MLQPFFVWENKALRKVHPEDVLFFSTEKNYTKIILENKTYFMVRSSLSGVLKKLPADVFIKIHRSHVASVYHIDSIQKDHLVVSDEVLPIGKPFYESLMMRLNVIE